MNRRVDFVRSSWVEKKTKKRPEQEGRVRNEEGWRIGAWLKFSLWYWGYHTSMRWIHVTRERRKRGDWMLISVRWKKSCWDKENGRREGRIPL